MARQPDDRRVRRSLREIEAVPGQEAEPEAGDGAEQRERRDRRAFAEAIEMRADAAAASHHADAEGEARRATSAGPTGPICAVGGRRPADGIGQPGAEDDRVADAADGERREDAQQAARGRAARRSRGSAEEAEARALQHDAEAPRRSSESDERPTLGAALQTQPEHGERRGDGRRPRRRPATIVRRLAGTDAAGEARPAVSSMARSAPGRATCPPQTVPALFSIGTPTALPYSVHEPS